MNLTIEQIGILGVLIVNLIALFKDIQKTRADINKGQEDIEHTTYMDLLEMYKLVKQERDDCISKSAELKKQKG